MDLCIFLKSLKPDTVVLRGQTTFCFMLHNPPPQRSLTAAPCFQARRGTASKPFSWSSEVTGWTNVFAWRPPGSPQKWGSSEEASFFFLNYSADEAWEITATLKWFHEPKRAAGPPLCPPVQRPPRHRARRHTDAVWRQLSLRPRLNAWLPTSGCCFFSLQRCISYITFLQTSMWKITNMNVC